MFVYNDAVGHMTRFQPPYWLLPPPAPAKTKETRLERLEVPGVGPHPEGLRIGKEGADPPPEDLESADGLTPLMAYWTGWPIMCPQAGSGI